MIAGSKDYFNMGNVCMDEISHELDAIIFTLINSLNLNEFHCDAVDDVTFARARLDIYQNSAWITEAMMVGAK